MTDLNDQAVECEFCESGEDHVCGGNRQPFALAEFDSIEIQSPHLNPDNPFWSVFGHYSTHSGKSGAEWLCNCASETIADAVAEKLNLLRLWAQNDTDNE